MVAIARACRENITLRIDNQSCHHSTVRSKTISAAEYVQRSQHVALSLRRVRTR